MPKIVKKKLFEILLKAYFFTFLYDFCHKKGKHNNTYFAVPI